MLNILFNRKNIMTGSEYRIHQKFNLKSNYFNQQYNYTILKKILCITFFPLLFKYINQHGFMSLQRLPYHNLEGKHYRRPGDYKRFILSQILDCGYIPIYIAFKMDKIIHCL